MSLRGSPIRRLELFNRESTSQTLVLTAEVQRLNSIIHNKNIQIKQLYDENRIQKQTYEQQIDSYANTIRLLQARLKQFEVSRNIQFQVIKEKYDKMAVEETQNMKSYHSHEIQFLLKEIAYLRVDCATKDQKLVIKDSQISSMTQSYQRQIQQKINEINNLNRALLSIEDSKNREIKQISSKRELQKSRTSGVLSSRKQNNQFMDKQIRKLNEQILQKAIKIENFTRQINKMKRRNEQTQKALNKKIQDIIAEKEEQSKEREEHFAKVEKSMKQQILEFKSNQVKFLSQIDSLKSTIEIHRADLQRYQQTIKSKEEQVNGYKEMLNKQRDDHAKQISNLMKERKRRSSNLGSSRSLSSSLKDAGGANSQESGQSNLGTTALKKLDSIRLATVKQQSPDKSLNQSIERSRFTDEAAQQQQGQLVKVIYHYDTLVEELKQSHSAEIELLKHKISKTTKSLDEKQQELLDILTRFSPLVKIHAEQKSVQEDRKERIERHWKADVALLEIMLQKYRIKVYE